MPRYRQHRSRNRNRPRPTNGIIHLRRRLNKYGDATLPQRYAWRTTKQYNGAFKLWLQFCRECGYYRTEYTPTTTFEFVCWRRIECTHYRTGEPVKATTIRSQLSAIKSSLITEGAERIRPCTKHTMPRTSALLSALEANEVADFKRPLTAMMIVRLCALLPDTHDARVFAFALKYAHNTIRRFDEIWGLTAGAVTWANGSRQPRYRAPLDASATISFNHSKGNQRGRWQAAELWCRCSNGGCCALCALRELYDRSPWRFRSNTPLFKLESGGLLTYARAMKSLKLVCISLGLNPNHFGTHSLRRGGLQDAQLEGQSDATINRQADWRTNRSRLPYESTRATIDDAKRQRIAASRRDSNPVSISTTSKLRIRPEVQPPAKLSRHATRAHTQLRRNSTRSHRNSGSRRKSS